MKKKINCESIPVGGIGKCFEPARKIGTTQISLENIRDFANQIPDNPEVRRSILIVGDFTKIAEHSEFVKLIEELKNKNIDIVVHSTQPMTISRITGDEILQLNKGYNHSYSATFPDPIGKFKRSLEELSELQKEFDKKTVLNFMNGHGKHIPIKGKFTKKGKGGQSGSNFHK